MSDRQWFVAAWLAAVISGSLAGIIGAAWMLREWDREVEAEIVDRRP